MDRAEVIQEIIEDLGQLKHLALADRTKLGALQLSKAQLELLYALSFHEKISVKQAAQRLSVSLSAVSQLADPLLSEGYITRQNDLTDRRIVHLSLTPKGKRIIKDLKKNIASGLRRIMETLDQRDLDNLNKVFKKLVANALKAQE